MSDTEIDAEARLSSETVAELRQLKSDHAINEALIRSLVSSKSEARAHLKFFKRMMIFSNGLVMFIGAAIAGFGVLRLQNGFSTFGLACLVAGALLFLKFASVFASMSRAIKATEAVAQKHQLI